MFKKLLFVFFIPIFLLGFGVYKSELKKKPFDFSYKEIIKEVKFTNLHMIGKVNKMGVYGETPTIKLYGKILRSLRYQNITKKIEKKYGLPKNILLAMVMQESGGVDLLINARNDGGAGLCHMQPAIASEFGLKVYKNSTKLRDYNLGKQLRKLIKNNNYDRKKLIKYDDRFHPIHNLEAVARMLVYYKTPKIKGFKNEWSSSIYRYAGKYNYRKYWQNVKYYRKRLNDKNTIKAVKTLFNSKNK